MQDDITKPGARRTTADHRTDVYILDIDGTLMRTHEIDNQCYWNALHEVFGLQRSPEGLDAYEHVSDSGILLEWTRRCLGRSPRPLEVKEIRARFLDLMRSAARDHPQLFEPSPGLEHWLEGMQRRDRTHVAIATGSWENTARFKLEQSGLARFGLALASADDAISRADIMSEALARLDLGTASCRTRITYIGDGPWDFRASCELGWSFIGIASGDRARKLAELGAKQVHDDFAQLLSRHGIDNR